MFGRIGSYRTPQRQQDIERKKQQEEAARRAQSIQQRAQRVLDVQMRRQAQDDARQFEAQAQPMIKGMQNRTNGALFARQASPKIQELTSSIGSLWNKRQAQQFEESATPIVEGMRARTMQNIGGEGGNILGQVGSAANRVLQADVPHVPTSSFLPIVGPVAGGIETALTGGPRMSTLGSETLETRSPNVVNRRIRGLPFAGETLGETWEGATSPVGAAAIAAFPAASAYGIGAGIAGGLGGQAAEDVTGVHDLGIGDPQSVGLGVAGIYGGPGGGVRRAGTAVSDVASDPRVQAGARRFATEETGAIRMPGRGKSADFGPPPSYTTLIDAPPDERLITTVERRFMGEVREEGERARLLREEIHSGARQSGVRFSRTRSSEMENLIDAVETGDLTSLAPEHRPTATRLREIIDEETQAMIAADPDFTEKALEDYFPHLFKKASKPRGGGAGPTPSPRFMRQRKLEGSVLEVLDRRPDLDLVTWDPVDLVYMRIAEGIKYRAGQRLLERLKSVGAAMSPETAPPDWRIPDAPIFQGKTAMWVDEATGKPRMRKLSWAVEPDAKKAFDDFFGRSAFSENAPLGVLRAGVQSAKLVKVFGGLFQHFDYTLRQLGSGLGEAVPGTAPGRLGRVRFAPQAVGATARAWARGFVPGIDSRMTRFDLSDPTRAALIRNGLQLDGGLDIMEREFHDLLKEPGFIARSGINENVVSKRVKGALDYFSSGAYLKSHREHVLSHGERLTKQYMTEGLPVDAAAAKAAKEANEHFSALPRWQSVFRDPTTRDIMRIGLFSPNEAESWTRNFFRGFTGPNRASAIRFYAGIIGTTIAWANIINYISTGKPLPASSYNPVSNEDSKIGIPFSYNTTFLRPEAPWKGPLGQREFIDILGQADTPIRWALDPAFGTQSRLGQLPRLAMDLAPAASGQQVRDFGGKPVESRGDFLRYGANQVSPLPVQSFTDERDRIGDTGAIVQGLGINVSAERLRDLLARRYEEITGERFNPDTGYLEAQTIPELAPILEEINKRSLEYQSPSAVERQERERFLTEQETSSGLPAKAQAVNQNQPGAGSAFSRAFSDLQTQAAIAAQRDFFGSDSRNMETPEGQALQAYRDIQPSNYEDPQTFEMNWGAYFGDKEKAFASLTPRLQQYLNARMTAQDPTVQQVEPRFKAARDAYRQYSAETRYQGLTPEEADHVDSAIRKADYLRITSGVDPNSISPRQLLPMIAEGLTEKETATLYALLSKSNARQYLENPNRDQLLLDNTDIIYFGFVPPSRLSLRQRTLLPEYILQGY